MVKKIIFNLIANGLIVGAYFGWEFYGSIGARNLLIAYVLFTFILVMLGFIGSLFTGKRIPRSNDPKWLVHTNQIIAGALAAVMIWHGHFILVGMYALSLLLLYVIREDE